MLSWWAVVARSYPPTGWRIRCEMHAYSEVLRQLDRHQRQRDAGIPTVSMLIGPRSRTSPAWSAWLRTRSLGCVYAGADTLIREWLNYCCHEGRLAGWLTRVAREQFDEGVDVLRRKTPYERKLADERHSDTDRVTTDLFWMLLDWPDSASDLRKTLTQRLEVVVKLVLPEDIPAIAVDSPHVHPSASKIAAWVQAAPTVPIVWILEEGRWQHYLESASESRDKSLLQSAVIELTLCDPRRLVEEFPHLEGSIARLLEDGCNQSLAQTFAQAARAHQRAIEEVSSEQEDEAAQRARSLAELFLFQRLESLPETAGLFELNERLPIPFGNRPMEVDLLCKKLRIALEVDGYYHFQSTEAYRRDRRKDYLLQEDGFWVVRVLAEDVMARLSEPLNMTIAAVRQAQGAMGRGK